MAKNTLPGSELLPTVSQPGTFAWCEEVVECMNIAWRTRETGEQGFLAAVRAAVQYRIWETLSPPPPEEPYSSFENLIRRTAEPGQAENMQITIRFSGVLEQAEGQDEDRHPQARGAAALSGPAGATAQTRVVLPGGELPGPPHALTEEEEIALGNALLEQYGADPAVTGAPPSALAAAWAAAQTANDEPAPAVEEAAGGSPRRSAAQRKRDRLERSHPNLAEAVDSGELTLKQAYVQAGIEKEVRTLDKLQKLWRSASEEERDRFVRWLDEQEQKERRSEYEQDVYGDDA